MDVSHARVALRQRPLLDVLDLTIRFVVSHAGVYARVCAVVLLPCAAFSWGFARSAGWGWGWLATAFLAMLAQTPFTALASRLVFQPEVRAREALGASARALPRLIFLRTIQFLSAGVGFFVFLLPGVWAQVVMMFVVEAATLEHASVTKALSRSYRLVSGRSGEALMAALALLALHLTAIVLADVVGRSLLENLVQFQTPEPLWTSGGGALSLLGFWLFVPFGATARFFVYLNLRTRTEGWDIQTRFAAIASRAEKARVAALGVRETEAA